MISRPNIDLRIWGPPVAGILVVVLLAGYLWQLSEASQRLRKRVEGFRRMRKEYVQLNQRRTVLSETGEKINDPLSYIEARTSEYAVDSISPMSTGNPDRRRFRVVFRSVPITAPFEVFQTISTEDVMRVESFRIERIGRTTKEFDSFFVLQQ